VVSGARNVVALALLALSPDTGRPQRAPHCSKPAARWVAGRDGWIGADTPAPALSRLGSPIVALFFRHGRGRHLLSESRRPPRLPFAAHPRGGNRSVKFLLPKEDGTDGSCAPSPPSSSFSPPPPEPTRRPSPFSRSSFSSAPPAAMGALRPREAEKQGALRRCYRNVRHGRGGCSLPPGSAGFVAGTVSDHSAPRSSRQVSRGGSGCTPGRRRFSRDVHPCVRGRGIKIGQAGGGQGGISGIASGLGSGETALASVPRCIPVVRTGVWAPRWILYPPRTTGRIPAFRAEMRPPGFQRRTSPPRRRLPTPSSPTGIRC